MLGAIAGDVIGSVHEGAGPQPKDFPLFVDGSTFTDDTVLSVAVAHWILDGGDLAGYLREYFAAYPYCGYGGMFSVWALDPNRQPYHSFGNGSAMRVSPVGFAFGTLEEVLDHAEQSAAPTHDHPEGIRGAQATAAAIYHAKRTRDKQAIRRRLESDFGYDLGRSLEQIQASHRFDETCQGTVPTALVCFLESTSFEDAVRNAVSLGGDADTLACIAGGIAEAYYGGVPADIAARVTDILDERLSAVVHRFRARFG